MRPLGYRDEHDANDADSSDEHADGGQRDHHQEEHRRDLVEELNDLLPAHDGEVVVVAGAQTAHRAECRDHLVFGLVGGALLRDHVDGHEVPDGTGLEAFVRRRVRYHRKVAGDLGKDVVKRLEDPDNGKGFIGGTPACVDTHPFADGIHLSKDGLGHLLGDHHDAPGLTHFGRREVPARNEVTPDRQRPSTGRSTPIDASDPVRFVPHGRSEFETGDRLGHGGESLHPPYLAIRDRGAVPPWRSSGAVGGDADIGEIKGHQCEAPATRGFEGADDLGADARNHRGNRDDHTDADAHSQDRQQRAHPVGAEGVRSYTHPVGKDPAR